MPQVFKLKGCVKFYEWGKLGADSSVAKLGKSHLSDCNIQPDVPFAELWMGTHPSGPASIPSLGNISLSDWIKDHPKSLGSRITDKFRSDGLPFLFKVLSVRKSLSIQVHPDIQTAKMLHERCSDLYPDDNHKPELAIALTNIQALCGFRPVSEIKAFILELQDLQSVIGNELTAEFMDSEEPSKDLLKKVFRKMITCPEETYQPKLQNLIRKFDTNMSLSDLCKSVKDVFLRICTEYSGDIGCFCVFFFNLMNLTPGESIFLAANEPHAYLRGDCIECMACSDNVIRAGLTPKYKDVEILCSVLSYECRQASENLFQCVADRLDPHIQVYNPPVPEFAVAKIVVQQESSPYLLSDIDSASIVIVIKGDAEASITMDSATCLQHDPEKCLALHMGTVLFISCSVKLQIKIISSEIIMYRAYTA